jgi:aarF domain-containing kinase
VADDEEKASRRKSRVPTGRIERLARIGWMTGQFAMGGVGERLRRVAGNPANDASVFLNPQSAERLARQLSRMRGAAMKWGQMLSLMDDSIVPPEFAEALAILRSSADNMPESQVRKRLLSEYGRGWEARFRDFDFEPIAAASIGQVHMATAKDGRSLALKIQYPGVSESIDNDVDNLTFALTAARVLPGGLDLSGIAEEFKQQFRQEADYLLEADFLDRYRELLRGDDRYAVPGVCRELTTHRVLAMDRILGLPLEDVAGAGNSQAARDEIGARLIELMLREIFEFRFMQTDPNFSNYLLLPDGETIGVLDLGCSREIPDNLVHHYANLIRALRSQDRDGIRERCVEMGFIYEDDPEDGVEHLINLLFTIYEPLTCEGVYTFGESDYLRRAQEMGIEMFFRHGFLRSPPAETIFAQRKIDGTLMLCSRIGARVDVASIVDEVLARAGL